MSLSSEEIVQCDLKNFFNSKLLVMTFFLFSCQQFFFKYKQKEQNFQNTSDDRPFLADLQYIGVSSVPSCQLPEMRQNWTEDQHVRNWITYRCDYHFVSVSFRLIFGLVFKKKLQPIFTKMSLFKSRQRKKNPAQNNDLNTKWTNLERRRKKTFSFSF